MKKYVQKIFYSEKIFYIRVVFSCPQRKAALTVHLMIVWLKDTIYIQVSSKAQQATISHC